MTMLRREFIAKTAVACSAGALPSGLRTLPCIKLGKYEVSRLIIGENPFYGHSHFNLILSRLMREWCTAERVCEILFRCEQEGINTFEFTHRRDKLEYFERYRAVGGKMQFILLSSRDMSKDHSLIAEMAKLRPIGIVHHGSITDRLFREKDIQPIREFLKRVRDSGVLAGVSTHNPAVIEAAEEQNWGADFYMACLYRINRTPEEFRREFGHEKPIDGEGDLYLPEDPPRMCRAIRQTPKPCLAFKVLAAGRLTQNAAQMDEAFRFAFQNIKPQDAIIVGMFPKYSDQVGENAERTRRILGTG